MNTQPEQRSPMEEKEDAVLVQEAKQGSRVAYEELVTRYHGKIYGLVYNMTSNREDAQDLVQDIFIKAYQSIARFKGKSSFYTWLYRIAVNRTINFVKKRKRKMAMSLNDTDAGLERDPAYVELSSKGGPDRDFSITELQEKLNEALQTLSEKHRTVVVLHDIQGIPHEEIAKMMKTSTGTVRSRLFYARQKLQVELKDFAP